MNEHSRLDPEHYMHCDACYEEHEDFMRELEDEARMDALIEAEQN